jgi:Tfp pilus assembly protein PilF
VVNPTDLTETIWNRKKFKADKNSFSYQTSAWITQEIGLAIGREMDLMLVLEKGVRKPGGLQGNLEYITFERDAPEKSYVKILEMIRALIPRAKGMPIESSEIRTAPEEHTDEKEEVVENKFQPRDDWNLNRYRIALFMAIMNKNEDSVKEIKESFLLSNFGRETKNAVSFEVLEEYYRISYGKGGDFTKLELLSKEHEENVDAQSYLARAYGDFEDHNKAAILFQVAAEKTPNEIDKLNLYGNAIVSFMKAGQKLEADAVIQKLRTVASKVENGEIKHIQTLCEVAEINNDQDLYFGLIERFLQIKPDDVDSRFNLAYKYGEVKQHDLSLFHYLKIPEKDRSASIWNNLGAEFNYCDLPNKSTTAYKKAEELGSTIAMSNLANKLINVGFLKEAEEICNRAIKYQDYHKNVLDSISSIKNVPEQEDKKEKPILDRVKPLSEFYREYGYASLQSGPENLAGSWRGPQCNLSLTIKDNQITATGNYERQPAYLFSRAVGATPGKKHYKIKYEGKVFGRAIQGVVWELEEEEPRLDSRASILTAALKGEGSENKSDVLMILSESLQEIRVYEKNAGKNIKFYSLKRID